MHMGSLGGMLADTGVQAPILLLLFLSEIESYVIR